MKKSIFDIFVDGARKGLNIGLNSVLPNVLMAYAIIQVLKVTGILMLLCAAAATGGEITLTRCCPAHMTAMLPAFEEMGCRLTLGESSISLAAPARLSGVRSIKTMPYPGFPTDIQAPLMATLCTASGSSMFVETIFESRYKHVPQLLKLGANIVTEGRVAVVGGVETLYGAAVECTDLRGGAALVIAALAAQGVSSITNLKHIDRGYCDFENTLLSLGAKVRREKEV